ncbi:dihydrodipicolinate synthetase [Nemania abortiva]|nr:dihydrodipicolinate synthetase [Nemania abortiva]
MLRRGHILRPGVYAPILTPFQKDGESINLAAFSTNVKRLATAGVGIVIGGTLGEGALLQNAERATMIKTARETIRGLNPESRVPIISGCVGASVKECVQQAQEAGAAGADAIIIAIPSYFAFVYARDKSTIKCFFTSIADKSPVPLFIYNIPFAAGGIDLDAEFLIDISEHQNICGVKLTCGSISKGYSIALHVNSSEYKVRHPLPFLVMPGSSDYLLPALIGRQNGCIAGPANLYPKTCVRVFQMGSKAIKTSDFELLRQAQTLQDAITEADSVINKVGFLGIKTASIIFVNEQSGGAFRPPLTAPSDIATAKLRDGLKRIFEIENSL